MKIVKLTLLALLTTLTTNAQTSAEAATATYDKDKEPDTCKVPFAGYDLTWQNGGDRRDHSVLQTKYFTGSFMFDGYYTHSFNNPIDNTVSGSTVVVRNNEMQVSFVGLGGDFNYKNARGRAIFQLGTRAIAVARNDVSPYRGQYDLHKAYRYLSDAYAGYHFNKWYGINVDFGLFTSYLGLNSYYQVENWEYQESYTSDNTPWFFNGMRIQIFPSKTVKIEPWIINGWQSYGRFNAMPGFGGNITWMPNENVKLATNDYFSADAPMIPARKRFHSDNCFLLQYYNDRCRKGISRAAFSVCGDIGFEKGGGVNAFSDKDSSKGPAQYYLSFMFYNRVWFAHNKFAWTIGGGAMTNPGRYMVLYPPGQASPLPDPNDPTKTEGAFPFSAWDCSTNIDWLPNQSLTIRLEVVHRESSVPYFAGRGGVTSPTGYATTPLPPGWMPDLVKQETRIIFAALFRI